MRGHRDYTDRIRQEGDCPPWFQNLILKKIIPYGRGYFLEAPK